MFGKERGGLVAPGGAGASDPITSVEAAAGAGIGVSAAFTGANDPAAKPERIAGAVERSSPGSLRQQGVAFKIGPLPASAMHEPQRSSGDGIFMPQLMIAAWQGAAPMTTNAKRTNVETRRFIDLFMGALFRLYPGATNDAPTGPGGQPPRYICSAGAGPCLSHVPPGGSPCRGIQR